MNAALRSFCIRGSAEICQIKAATRRVRLGKGPPRKLLPRLNPVASYLRREPGSQPQFFRIAATLAFSPRLSGGFSLLELLLVITIIFIVFTR